MPIYFIKEDQSLHVGFPHLGSTPRKEFAPLVADLFV